MQAHVLANFGGPRTLEEVEPFLKALLTDQDVVRTGLPKVLHNLIFRRVAKKRSKVVVKDYASIGGGSPIYADTEWMAQHLDLPVIPFHRYLPSTHREFLERARAFDRLVVFPMFPQFTYATSGSIARWMEKHLSMPIEWVRSYPTHPAYIDVWEKIIREELPGTLLFSAHGTPINFGDNYQQECEATVAAVMERFPSVEHVLAYQSQFGKAEWLKPSTADVCRSIEGEKIVVVPISFTSDHIETLFEIEQDYLPILRERGLEAVRVPAPNRREDWASAIVQILQESKLCKNKDLIRM